MKKLLIVFALILLSCSSGGQNTGGEILSDVLTFEFSFGDDDTKLPEEYLLANPYYGFVVNDAGDIIVADENSLKVFNSKGEAKTILGGPGQGPGEFDSISYLTISPENHITAKASFGGDYNILDRDLNFVEKFKFDPDEAYNSVAEQLNLRRTYPREILTVNNNEKLVIYGGEIQDQKSIIRLYTRSVIYEKNNKPNLLCSYSGPRTVEISGIGGASLRYVPDLMLALLPDHKIVHVWSGESKSETDGSSIYILNITSVDGSEIKKIEHPYEKVLIPDTLLARYRDTNRRGYTEEIDGNVLKYYTDNPYFPSMEKTLSDRNYIFVFTYKKNEDDHVLADVFDAEEGLYLRSVWFPFVPRVIKNAKAYNLIMGRDVFPRIEVYSIDPGVYER